MSGSESAPASAAGISPLGKPLSPCDQGGILGFVQHSDGTKGNVLKCDSRALENRYIDYPMETEYIQMDGWEVFAFSVRQVPASIREVLEKIGTAVEDIDFFVLHQANKRIIEGIAKRLSVDP